MPTPSDRPLGPPAHRPGKSLAAALGVALALLACCELGARWWESEKALPHSYEAPRNPSFRRGWPAFTAPRERPAGVALVIVIGNSQGFLREQPDGGLAHPARLAARLGEEGVEAIVANWSVPAAQGPELVILAARAAQHDPDLVVLSSGTRGFATDRVETAPLSYWLSDVPDLAYLPGVRGSLPRAFLRRTRAFEPMGFLRANSAFVRLRFLAETRAERWSWEPAPRRRRNRRRRLGLPPPNTEILRTLLIELSTALRPGGTDTPLLVVNMPICRDGWRRGAYRRARTLSVEAAVLFADDPRTRVFDARSVVPDEHFSTPTHLTPLGHRIYAEWLLPRVLAGLGRPRATPGS